MSTGRHSGGLQSRNSKNDGAFKKYRPLVPAGLSDMDLHDLIRTCENVDDALVKEIQALWDKEADTQNVENEFFVVEKKPRKKEAPPVYQRPDRMSRAGKSSGRVAGDHGAKIPKAVFVPATDKGRGEEFTKVNEISDSGKGSQSEERSNGLGLAPAQRSSVASVADAIQDMNSPSSIPGLNSVWGGGSSLAQKIKTAEKMKAPSSSFAEGQVSENPPTIESSNNSAMKSTNKSKSRREKKGQAGGKAGNKAEAVDAVETPRITEPVPEPETPSVQAEVSIDVVVEPAVDQSPSMSDYRSDGRISAVESVPEVKCAPAVENVGSSDENLVNLGKWATSNEPIHESSFQFGNFGGESSDSATGIVSPMRTDVRDSSSKSPSKNWKSGDNNRKNSSANIGNNTGAARNVNNPSWETANAGRSEFGRTTTDGRQSSDTSAISLSQPVSRNATAAMAPPGLSASQNLETSKGPSTIQLSGQGGNQRGGNSRKSHDSEQTGKHQHAQSTPPPGINQRTPSGTGFGGIVPAGMVSNIPYGGIPYDISHQAPSLHHTGSYGMMQPNFSGASALSATPAASPTTPSGSGTSSAAASSQQPAGGSAATTQHQPAYQSAPPGMPAYMPYSYNPPYYGHQFYYGGQPQGYYNRGQPMYQQPPRAMYGNDAYNANAHGLAGYPDMYGAQAAPFGDSQYTGGTVHHHGPSGHGSGSGSERGGKQKNSSSSSSGATQQPGGASADSHAHGTYPGYGGSYTSRDGQGQYPYQGGWNSAPMMYPHVSPQVIGGPAANFQGGGRGQHETPSKTSGAAALNGSSYSSSHYVGGGRGGNSNPSNAASQSGNAAPGSGLQSNGW